MNIHASSEREFRGGKSGEVVVFGLSRAKIQARSMTSDIVAEGAYKEFR
jgi:hypothetical protein